MTIGIVTLQMRAPYFVAMVRALEAEAAKRPNVRVIVADGGGDVAKVSSDIEDLLARNVDGLIMNISPLESLPGPMAAIQRAGKRLVLVNRKLSGRTRSRSSASTASVLRSSRSPAAPTTSAADRTRRR